MPRIRKILEPKPVDSKPVDLEKTTLERMSECIELLTKNSSSHEKTLVDHEKRISLLEGKCADAPVAASSDSEVKAQPESKPVTSNEPSNDGYAVEDGPRVMYKYHKRIKTDDGRFVDTWAGPKMTRKEAEQSGSGLTQEILAWVKNGKIVLVEPIASRERF